MPDLKLVIPTYRLVDAAATVQEYRENLSRYGHDVPIIVFDDTKKEAARDDFPRFRQGKFKNTFYVGWKEKETFREHLREQGLEAGIIERMLRPSYGGNRNFTVLYTIGDFFISADDDMRPHGLLHEDRQELEDGEVLKGVYLDKKDPRKEIVKKDFDLVKAYLDVLGKKVGEVDGAYLTGSTLNDSMTDLHTNMTAVVIEMGTRNTVTLMPGAPDLEARIVTAQTFRSGSADVDSVDYARDFMVNPLNVFINDMSLRYVITGFRPCVSNMNWRLDCGISAYDNTQTLPPFLPTKLRFEDYGYRLWLQDSSIAAAHVNAVQTHYRNPYNRESLAHDLWNEAMANYLKPLLREQVRDFLKHGMTFSEEGLHVSLDDAKSIMDKGRDLYFQSVRQAKHWVDTKEEAPITRERMIRYFLGFAEDLFEQYNGFESGSFHEKMQKTITDEYRAIRKTMEVWPRVLEIAGAMKKQGSLPIRRIAR